MDDTPADNPDAEPDWIPLDQNPHAEDKRDVLDPVGEGGNYQRLILVGLVIGVVAVALVVWLAVL